MDVAPKFALLSLEGSREPASVEVGNPAIATPQDCPFRTPVAPVHHPEFRHIHLREQRGSGRSCMHIS